MSDALNPKAQAFLRSVEHDDDPSRDDYDRVHAGVKARLAASVAAGVAALVTAKAATACEVAAVTTATTAATAATAAATAVTATAVTSASVGGGAAVPAAGGAGAAFVTKLVAVVLVVGAAAGGTTAVVRYQRSEPTRAPETTVNQASVERPVPPAQAPARLQPMATVETAPATLPVLATPPAAAPTTPLAMAPATPPASPLAPAATTMAIPPAPATPITLAPPVEPVATPSPLDAEIALVREARAALRGGDAGRALTLLDEHARLFPRGALAEDCDAERIHAMCALGRTAEARSLSSRFLTAHPASPHAPSVRSSCGGGMD